MVTTSGYCFSQGKARLNQKWPWESAINRSLAENTLPCPGPLADVNFRYLFLCDRSSPIFHGNELDKGTSRGSNRLLQLS